MEAEKVFAFPPTGTDRVEIWREPVDRLGVTELCYQLRVFVHDLQTECFRLPEQIQDIGAE